MSGMITKLYKIWHQYIFTKFLSTLKITDCNETSMEKRGQKNTWYLPFKD